LRPAEVYHLRGDYSKARQRLGWEPAMPFEQLVAAMVDSDINLISKGTSRAALFAA